MKHLAVPVLIILVTHAIGQDIPSRKYADGDILIGPTTTFASIQNFSTKFGLGVTGEYFLGKNFGFGYGIAGGPDYAEFSSSILGLLGVITINENKTIFTLFIPLFVENPRVHIQPGRNSDLSLSLNLMKFRYIFDDDQSSVGYYGNDHWFASGSATLGLTLSTQNDWQLYIYVEGTSLYYPGKPKGVQFGIALTHLGHVRPIDFDP